MKKTLAGLIPFAALALPAGSAAHPQDATTHGLQGELAEWKLEQLTAVRGPGAVAKLEALKVRAEGLDAEAREGAAAVLVETRALLAKARAVQAPPAAASSQGPPATPGSKVLDRRIEDAVENGNKALITDLGKRAVPTLRRLALGNDGTAGPDSKALDPLRYLFYTSMPDAFEVAFELLERDDILVKRGVAKAIAAARPFQRGEAWQERPGQGDLLLDPAWGNILLKLAQEPDLGADQALQQAITVMQSGWAPPELHPLMAEMLPNSMMLIQGYAELGGLAEYLATQDLPGRRETAAEYFKRTGDLPSLYAMAEGSNEDVMGSIAYAMGRYSTPLYVPGIERPQNTRIVPEVDDLYRKTLLTLWQSDQFDDVSDLFGRARELQQRAGGPAFTLDYLMQFVPRAWEARYLDALKSYSWALAPEDRAAFLISIVEVIAAAEELDADERQDRTQQTLTVLGGLAPWQLAWSVQDRVDQLGLVGDKNRRRVAEELYEVARGAPESSTRFLEWMRSNADLEAWTAVISKNGLQSPSSDFQRFARGLSGEGFAEVLRAVGDQPQFSPTRLMSPDACKMSLEALEALFLDAAIASNTAEFVLQAMGYADAELRDPDAVAERAAKLFLTSPTFDPGRYALPRCGIDPELVMLRLLRDLGADLDVLARLENPIQNEELRSLILAKDPVSEWSSYPASKVRTSIIRGTLGSQREDRQEFILQAMAQAPNYWNLVTAYVQSKPRPEDFELLKRFFEEANRGGSRWDQAIVATTSYLNDEAGELLLEVAKQPLDTEQRAKVMAGLDTILDWQAASARWKRSQTAEAKRQKAIDELLTIIADSTKPEVARAEAIRGLGLLDATAEIPRLIGALESQSEALRAAAREALDRLNRSK